MTHVHDKEGGEPGKIRLLAAKGHNLWDEGGLGPSCAKDFDECRELLDHGRTHGVHVVHQPSLKGHGQKEEGGEHTKREERQVRHRGVEREKMQVHASLKQRRHTTPRKKKNNNQKTQKTKSQQQEQNHRGKGSYHADGEEGLVKLARAEDASKRRQLLNNGEAHAPLRVLRHVHELRHNHVGNLVRPNRLSCSCASKGEGWGGMRGEHEEKGKGGGEVIKGRKEEEGVEVTQGGVVNKHTPVADPPSWR